MSGDSQVARAFSPVDHAPGERAASF